MAVKIELKRSAVPGKVPTTSSLALGEVAINTYDGKLYFKKEVSGVQSIVELTGASGSFTSASYALTSSFAATASYFSGSISNAISASFAATASFTPNAIVTASVSQNTITFTKGNNTTFSITVNTGSGGGTGAGFPFSGSAVITGSLVVTGSIIATQGVTASLFGTASWASNAISSSFASSSQNAQDLLVYVKNVTGVQIDKGKVVRISGATGDNALIALADWTDDANSANTLGLTVSNIANDAFGYVMTEGTLIGIDTSLYTAGQLLFLASSGSITGSAPLAPLHAVRLGQVLRVQGVNGSIYVRIDNGYELDELHDVRIVNPVTGQALVRSGSLWINGTPASASFASTSSVAVSASFAQNALTSSFAATTSLAPGYVLSSSTSSMLAPYLLSSQTGSMTVATASTALNAISSSFASTASATPNAIITASVSQNTITFTKGDGSTFPLTVNTGSGGGGGGTGAGFPFTGSAIISGSLQVTGSIVATAGITGSVFGTSSWATSASISNIQYVTNSVEVLSQIEVLDYSADVVVNYTGGRLKFIFGTPATHSITSFSFNSTFLTDRFNQVLDEYTASAVWTNGGYTLISASIFEGSVLLAQTGTGTTLAFPTITSGSHTYTLAVTASNPVDNSILIKTSTLAGTLSKSNPGTPTITPTATVQLSAASNQIEQGATGSITFTTASGAANGWVLNFVTSSRTSPIAVVGALTGSTSIGMGVTASYSSSGVAGSDNSPALVTAVVNSATFNKIRSLRSGATVSASLNQGEIENLSAWDPTLGGTVGTILKGTTTASGQSVTINWTGDKYHYIVYNGSLAFLTNITAAGFGVLSSFTSSSVGEYKVYRTNLLQAGGAGQTITYALT